MGEEYSSPGMARSVPRKKETLLAYLARGIAMVHLDARRAGVVVPSQYSMDAHLRLNLSYRYGIPDLDISDQRIQATLSFGSRPFRCVLPWGSVFAITCHGTGDGQVWPEDLPVEVVHTMADRQNGRRASAAEDPASRKPSLSAVEGDLKEEPQRVEPPDGAPRPHLRLVR
ncbi:MAG: stringent starvation protein B [Deltaproteobacteria bacterium]|jgi:stringent starvation protein B|nr:MAG: stringent starvation protein B [Deltaproteobacteria bacterium]TMB27369.1 MAG: stringent starvation protein B [Deltaproteobacteria bacterium]